ncbi:hypothetical protein I7I51_02739 [Histoplasma capsulatum]|uniref:Uncharacterized protein n=1 Tax=Ajellomyces capsulatus TaxID=5037 RepID=A0A8A1MKB1_AJECA|nr:hypothetical protein I7I51_02739 [Histoplasma capsulatum]
MSTVQSWTWDTEISEATANSQDPSEASSALRPRWTRYCEPLQALTSLHYRYSGKWFPNCNAIMPSNFPAPLLPHQSSLEELVVYAQPHQHISLQHPTGDVMKTMRGFAALKRLGLPAWWMVRPSSKHRERQVTGASYSAKIVEMLPLKLEIL